MARLTFTMAPSSLRDHAEHGLEDARLPVSLISVIIVPLP